MEANGFTSEILDEGDARIPSDGPGFPSSMKRGVNLRFGDDKGVIGSAGSNGSNGAGLANGSPLASSSDGGSEICAGRVNGSPSASGDGGSGICAGLVDGSPCTSSGEVGSGIRAGLLNGSSSASSGDGGRGICAGSTVFLSGDVGRSLLVPALADDARADKNGKRDLEQEFLSARDGDSGAGFRVLSTTRLSGEASGVGRQAMISERRGVPGFFSVLFSLREEAIL